MICAVLSWTIIIKVKVGQATIKQEQSAKLLGIQIEDSQKWNEQINGVGGTISSLNQRLYFIRRLKTQVRQESIPKVVNSLWTSKLRYGLQLFGKTRTQDSQPQKDNMPPNNLRQFRVMNRFSPLIQYR